GSTFSNNGAGLGGGIYNAGVLTASACTFTLNTALSGGAVYNDNAAAATATASLSDCTLYGNTTGGFGGGVFNFGGGLTTPDSTIPGTSSPPPGALGVGGGVNSPGTPTLNGDLIVGNMLTVGTTTAADDLTTTAVATSSDNLVGAESGGVTAGQN